MAKIRRNRGSKKIGIFRFNRYGGKITSVTTKIPLTGRTVYWWQRDKKRRS